MGGRKSHIEGVAVPEERAGAVGGGECRLKVKLSQKIGHRRYNLKKSSGPQSN